MPTLQPASDSSDLSIKDLERIAADIEAQTRECEQFLREAPERIAEERAERAATMPPPDDLADRRRERRFYELVSRGELRNERRAQAGSTLLFMLLLVAATSLVMWVLRLTT
jgi:hypothetical protein